MTKETKQTLWKSFRRFVWALIVAFMVGVHNFYQQKQDSPESIKSKIELVEKQEDDRPKIPKYPQE